MKITLYKYRCDNYFTKNKPTFLDVWSTEKFYIDGIGSIEFEHTKEDEITAIVDGGFDIKFSLLDDTKSRSNKNIEDFLMPINQYERDFLIMAIWEVGSKTVAGVVDYSTIQMDRTLPDNKLEIGFSCIGILKHVIDYLDTVFVGQMLPFNDMSFSSYINNWHFNNMGIWIQLDDRLNMETKCGFEVDTISNLQNNFFYGGLNQGYTVWSGLKSMMQTFGFNISIDYFLTADQFYPRFRLKLFWADEMGDDVDISIINDVTSVTLDYAKKYIFLNVGVSNYPNQSDIRYGFLLFPTGYYIRDYVGIGTISTVFHFEQGFIRVLNSDGSTLFEVKESEVEVINVALHATGNETFNYNLAYTHIFRNKNLPETNFRYFLEDIMIKTSIPYYKYLISGIKRVKNYTIIYDWEVGFNLNLYDRFQVDGITYYINKLKINILDRTADITGVEI